MNRLLATCAAVLVAIVMAAVAIHQQSDGAVTSPGLAASGTPTTASTGQKASKEKFARTITWVEAAPIRVPRRDDTYDREAWPHWRDAEDHGWTKAPNDYCDARQATLARDGRDVRVDPDTCEVISGTWVGPYTGDVIVDPGDLDVDHVVPLAAAHRAGADQWGEERKTAYANDPGVLLATGAEANRAKGDQAPDQWVPANRSYWCAYGIRWATIKHDWALAYTSQAEKRATMELLARC